MPERPALATPRQVRTFLHKTMQSSSSRHNTSPKDFLVVTFHYYLHVSILPRAINCKSSCTFLISSRDPRVLLHL